jgi:hypothetical protein
MASLRVVKRSDLRQFIDLALLLHFSDLQDVIHAERNGHQLVNRLAKLRRLADRKETELVEILERWIVGTVKPFNVDLAL